MTERLSDEGNGGDNDDKDNKKDHSRDSGRSAPSRRTTVVVVVVNLCWLLVIAHIVSFVDTDSAARK